MIVLVLSACPVGLRGDLTKWLYEISAGVFVGKVSARVRDHLWSRVEEFSGTGRAILIWTTRSEQGLGFRVKDHHWQPEDIDGLTLMRRPPPSAPPSSEMRPGWSKAASYRRGQRFSNKRGGENSQLKGLE
ncbi:type I-E CRISPR-associated endoribonuclease Cas2e [Flaviflexus huanghaiensis]|uniref:type I-E CRISPR-associated endoribonuclease Cas2e n=1 Tax=Flaviflexus huanghaiensis TaxID=1111473 RepID=UPI0015F83B2E|nr:type I-E CRISPR-associated endoribonuclease Cas2e [Flaviflexus huanghaiensis]